MKFGKTHDAVGRYRLSIAADEDLIGIALFGDEHFGIAQSNRYRDQLERQFSALAEQPLLYLQSTISANDTGAACAAYIRSSIGSMERSWKSSGS